MIFRKLLRINCFIQRHSSFTNARSFKLDPIGSLQEYSGIYKGGQFFIHKIFGYRGIILKSLTGKMYDKDLKSNNELSVLYYNVLVDSNDLKSMSYIKCGLTFLTDGKKQGNSMYIMPDMDYVSHDDVIPFKTLEGKPIVNEYFNNFFVHCPDQDPTYVPTEKLNKWLTKHFQSLEITNIQREVSEDIRITVMPFYLGTVKEHIENGITTYWRYIVRIENLGDSNSTLRARNLKIFSLSGRMDSVSDKGVAGNQPLLSKENSVFQYHSHVQLKSAWGHMWGSYTFERENGSQFDVKIPSFQLCSNISVNPSSYEVDDI